MTYGISARIEHAYYDTAREQSRRAAFFVSGQIPTTALLSSADDVYA